MPNYTKVWNKAIPVTTEAASLGASRIRDLKYALEERLATEHADVSGSGGDAKLTHLAGRCGVCFYGTTAQIAALTTPPQYSFAFDTDLSCFKYYTGSAWVIGPSLLPWMYDIDPLMTPASNTGWNTPTLVAGAFYYGYNGSAGNQNDIITWNLILAAGTWSVEVMYGKSSAAGIMSIQFDAVEKGTIDCYAAGVAVADSLGNRTTISSIAVATTAKVAVSLKMATKNAGSTSYLGYIQQVRLLRTA